MITVVPQSSRTRSRRQRTVQPRKHRRTWKLANKHRTQNKSTRASQPTTRNKNSAHNYLRKQVNLAAGPKNTRRTLPQEQIRRFPFWFALAESPAAHHKAPIHSRRRRKENIILKGLHGGKLQIRWIARTRCSANCIMKGAIGNC